jgi:hypothetical protein
MKSAGNLSGIAVVVFSSVGIGAMRLDDGYRRGQHQSGLVREQEAAYAPEPADTRSAPTIQIRRVRVNEDG